MNGVTTYPPRSFGANDCLIALSFQTVGSTVGPATALRSARGLSAFTAVHQGSGVYVVTLPFGFGFPDYPWTVVTDEQFDDLSDRFESAVIGECNIVGTNRQFTINTHRGGSPYEPPDAAGSRVNVWIVAGNTTGS